MVWRARLLLVLKGAGTLVYSYCLIYTVTHHVINYVVVSAAAKSLPKARVYTCMHGRIDVVANPTQTTPFYYTSILALACTVNFYV